MEWIFARNCEGTEQDVYKRQVLKNSGIAFGILGIATAFCFLVQRISESDTHVPLLFVLAVLFVSRFTDGYVYGIVASIIAVFGCLLYTSVPVFVGRFNIGVVSLHLPMILAKARQESRDFYVVLDLSLIHI